MLISILILIILILLALLLLHARTEGEDPVESAHPFFHRKGSKGWTMRGVLFAPFLGSRFLGCKIIIMMIIIIIMIILLIIIIIMIIMIQ